MFSNIIKSLVNQGYRVSLWKENDMYRFQIDGDWMVSSFDMKKLEEKVLDYIINDAEL